MTKALTTITYGIPKDPSGLVKWAASGGDDIVGDPLQLNGKTGLLTSGSQGHEHPNGSEFAFIVGETKGGFIQFEGGTLVKQAHIRMADPDADLAALRDSLGNNNPDEWPDTLPSGLPKDPFNQSVQIPCADMRTGSLYTFRTASFWGCL